MDVAAWLRSLGLERYEEAFRAGEIDWAGKLKQFRRVATRYDKLDPHYLAFVQIASALVRLRTFGGAVQRR